MSVNEMSAEFGVYLHYLLSGGVLDRRVILNAVNTMVRIQVFVEGNLEQRRASLPTDFRYYLRIIFE
jgi:hypothetical protein